VLSSRVHRGANRVAMRCYYHQDREAVGTCKSCGKGLCSECAVDLDKGLACRGRCEQDVRAVIQLVERNIRMEPTASRLLQSGRLARLAAGLFMLGSGALFLIFGLFEGFLFGIALGSCFIVYGVFVLWWSRRVSSKAKSS
jgi:hypothetical protein